MLTLPQPGKNAKGLVDKDSNSIRLVDDYSSPLKLFFWLLSGSQDQKLLDGPVTIYKCKGLSALGDKYNIPFVDNLLTGWLHTQLEEDPALVLAVALHEEDSVLALVAIQHLYCCEWHSYHPAGWTEDVTILDELDRAQILGLIQAAIHAGCRTIGMQLDSKSWARIADYYVDTYM